MESVMAPLMTKLVVLDRASIPFLSEIIALWMLSSAGNEVFRVDMFSLLFFRFLMAVGGGISRVSVAGRVAASVADEVAVSVAAGVADGVASVADLVAGVAEPVAMAALGLSASLRAG